MKKILISTLLTIPFLLPFVANAQLTLGNGLIGYWPFDTRDYFSSTVIIDRSGFKHNGTLVNSPTKINGVIGQALSMTGALRYVTTAINSGFNSRTLPWTISAWIKPTTNGSAGQTIIDTAINSPPFDGIWFQYGTGFGSGTTNSLIVGETDTSVQSIYAYTAIGTVPTNQWTHLVATYNGNSASTGIAIFINGVPVSVTRSGTSIAGSITDRPWIIGTEAALSSVYSGSIDDVRVYNRVLTGAEIQLMYRQGGVNHKGSFLDSIGDSLGGII